MINYRLPAEWEKHFATIIAWPHNKNDWPGKFSPIHWIYADIVKKISNNEKVIIIVNSINQKERIKKILLKVKPNFTNIEFYKFETDRSWMRDTCPAFVKINNETTAAIHFKFNGWAKYNNWKKDFYLPNFISKKLKLNTIKSTFNNQHVVLEGGAIDINGKGTLITTEECLLDKNVQSRNPDISKKDYEKIFNDYLGITNVIWLNKGIAGDDTHGHIDDLCRFVNKNTVVLCSEKNNHDENYENLKENFEIISNAKLENGNKLNVVKLPMPAKLIFDGMRLPASYANFYITNNSVLVPTFNDKNDRTALNIIAELFPERETIGINSLDLVWGLGTIHCLTHEVPA